MKKTEGLLLETLILAALLLVIARPSPAYTSPPERTTVTIAGKKIGIDYYAPSRHERKIMGGLVPFGDVWCTGANLATQINTEADLEIGDLKLPKGSYSIWTIPNEKEWTLILNKETGQSHLDYNPSLDLGRTKMTVKTLTMPVETFKIELRAAQANKGTLALVWENTEAAIPFKVVS
jgi:Protein of unknown function (DUF2911)